MPDVMGFHNVIRWQFSVIKIVASKKRKVLVNLGCGEIEETQTLFKKNSL